uniref:Uncharacterized protein n=1 Tax=Arundo donax TaxID=35708 RepID=A0A0A9A4B0_ARUDO
MYRFMTARRDRSPRAEATESTMAVANSSVRPISGLQLATRSGGRRVDWVGEGSRRWKVGWRGCGSGGVVCRRGPSERRDWGRKRCDELLGLGKKVVEGSRGGGAAERC